MRFRGDDAKLENASFSSAQECGNNINFSRSFQA